MTTIICLENCLKNTYNFKVKNYIWEVQLIWSPHCCSAWHRLKNVYASRIQVFLMGDNYSSVSCK
jgi:hypothetical protein